MENDLLGINDIIALLGIGRNSAYKLLKSKAIPSIKLGKRHMVRRCDLANYINNQFISQAE